MHNKGNTLVGFLVFIGVAVGLYWISGGFSGNQDSAYNSSSNNRKATGNIGSEIRCHPSYSGCLDSSVSDYDCLGGSGNGPRYTGRVKVIGYDEFGLDRDGDGWGCE